jgi:hypothetical protein
MANEYGELEQLVNDVTSLDTARMTLRWALERLNTIEKEKADLKKSLTLAEEASKKLQLKDAALQNAYSSRSKTLEEKEDFYTKLEATMSLLGEGKLDIQQLLKKEAKLDSLRKSLENEYQEKFDDLDRNQRAVIERWNARLLEVEGQYAGRLAESQKKYDSLRAELESEYQGRMTALQASFKTREAELTSRIGQLEGGVRVTEEKLEARRAELEKEHLQKRREADENYRKLRSMLETGFEEKLRAMDSDHEAQVRSLEASWQTERARLLEEQRVREEQFAEAQARLNKVENELASQQERHHTELLKVITEKEAAFRTQLAELEREKARNEAMVKELVSRLEQKTSDWETERTRLEAEFGRRLAGMEEAIRARAGDLEREYAAKREELENVLAVSREEFEKEFKARLAMERQALEDEKSRLAEERGLREESLARAADKVKELETALAATREEHHKELMERIRSGEASFRGKLAEFEAEKLAYNKTINSLTDELRRAQNSVLEEKKKIAAEFGAKEAIHSELYAKREAAFEAERLAYEEKVAALSARLEETAKASAVEKENFKNELARVSAEVNALAEQRAAAIRADYEARKAELEKDFSARYGDRLKGLEAEKSRMEEALAERERQLESAFSEAKKLDAEIAAVRMTAAEEKAALSRDYEAGMRAALKAAEDAAKAREAELAADLEVLRGELAEKDRQLAGERARLVDELSKASIEAHNRGEERAAAVKAEYEARLASLEAEAENRMAELKEAIAAKEALLQQALAGRETAEAALKAAFAAERAAWQQDREKLAEDFEKRLAGMEAGLAERAAAIRADYEARKAELEKDFSARYGDRLKGLEAEKSRMEEALAERERQLESAFSEAKKLDAEIAAVRMTAAEEKAALSRDYEAGMRAALKAAEDAAKAREAELAADLEVLRGELAEKDRQLAGERARLVDELSKASIEAHNRGEERAAGVKAEYEARLASLETAAEARAAELKEQVALKEALLEKAAAERAAAERDHKAVLEAEKARWALERDRIAADFDRRAAELENGISSRASSLEADYAARRERLEAELKTRTEAVHAEVSGRMDFERQNWQAERSRLGNVLAETAANFKAAQKEIEALSSGLRAAAEDSAAREARFNKELMEAKANFDRELAFRVKDAVAVQTSHLVEALAEAKAKQEELSALLDARDASIRAMRAEGIETRRDYEERLRSAGSDAVDARRAELEKAYAEKQTRLEEGLAALRKELEADYNARRAGLADEFALRNERLASENAALKDLAEKARAEAAEAGKRAAAAYDEMLAAAKAAQDEKNAMKRAQAEDIGRAVADAVKRAVEVTAQKLRAAEEELARAQESSRDEIAMLNETFNREKERMLEEMSRRERYVEAADIKIQELERDIMKYRQNASGELLKQISEQDERFRVIVAEEKARREAREKAFADELARTRTACDQRVKQLEELLSAKEKLMADSDGLYRRKQLELDALHADFNQSVNRFNEELFAQKQALSEKEKALNEYRLKLEKEYSGRNSEVEKLRAELSRAIIEYKNRK